ncbi:MAG: DUF6600 domain-containing protein [Candidatus Acidiferrales bacterium]|jgi:hypothetical protein
MRKQFSRYPQVLLIVGLLLGFPHTAAAQDADPPGRVARLNYAQGAVSFEASGENDWVDANLNRPLTTGDNLWVDKDSSGEVHIGSTAIRLASETGISILNLDDRTAQIQLVQGTIEVHLRRLETGNAWEIDTPNVAFALSRAGEYLIQADPDGGSTMIIVREGEGQVTGAGESWDLIEGQQYTFAGTDQLIENAQQAPAFDDFENWCQERDQRENNSQSAKYVSRDIDGYYDLDDAGTWQNDPDDGPIWIPTAVAGGWTPYRFGHWVWIAPWGWTWVADESWGFAPFHYGRWALFGGYWGWIPGPLVVRPYYAPALVGFVGGGFGFAVGFGSAFSGVAWFPLGPRDVFIPGYRASPRYVQYVNITNSRLVNVAQVTTVYNNFRANNESVSRSYTYADNARAVTAVPKDAFVNARPVGLAAVSVTSKQLTNAKIEDTHALAPTHASYVASNAKAATAKPPAAFADRKFAAKLNPPAPANHQSASRATNQQALQPQKNAGTPQASPERAPAQPEYQQHPSAKFTPPTNARDSMYDVHPPLNTQPPPQRQQEQRPSPAPRPAPAPSPAPAPAPAPKPK